MPDHYMQDEAELRSVTATQLRQQLEAAQQEAASQAAAAAAADDANASLSRQLAELRGQVKASGQQVGPGGGTTQQHPCNTHWLYRDAFMHRRTQETSTPAGYFLSVFTCLFTGLVAG